MKLNYCKFLAIVSGLTLLALHGAFGRQPLVQKWEKVGPITFTAAARQSASTIVLVTSHGYLYISNDNGISWRRQEIADTLDLTDISFADSLHGMILENGWDFLVTGDGGASWQAKRLPNSLWGPFYVEYTSPDSAYITNFIGNIYRTIDGGANWVEQYTVSDTATMTSAFPLKMRFFGNDRGYVVGMNGMYVETTDAGEHWIHKDITGDQTPLTDIDFADSVHGVISAWGACYTTTDAGNTWTAHKMPDTAGTPLWNNLTTVSCINVQSFFMFSQYEGYFYVSSDFGQTLTPIPMRQATSIGNVVKTGNGWLAVGGFGTICTGVVPEATSTPAWTAIAECPLSGNSLFHATNGRILQSISGEPYPLISKDSGILWNVADLRYQNYNGIHFPTPDTGYLFNSGDLSVGMTTHDSGQTWKPVEMNAPIKNEGVKATSFATAHAGFAIMGSNIVGTTDGGINWEAHPSPVRTTALLQGYATCNSWPERIFATDSLHAYLSVFEVDTLMVHQTGKSAYDSQQWYYYLYFSTDAGDSWSQITSLPFVHINHDLYFRGAMGILTCDSGRIVRTTDGGNSWEIKQLATFSHNIVNINFLTDRIGFLSLDSEAVLETTDGGDTWNMLLFPTNYPEVSSGSSTIFFPDSSTVLVCAADGFYRGKIDLGTASVTQSKVIPRGLTISTYPNPAHDVINVHVNPTTPVPVSFEIVDILGRVISRSTHEENSNLLLDVRSLPTGVYTIRCDAGGDQATATFTIVR